MPFDLASYTYPRMELAAAAWPGDSTVPRTAMQTQLHVPEGTHVTLLGRARTEDNSLLVQADVDNIVLRVFERPVDSPAAEVFSETLTVADVVFDSMQTDARWRGDSVGYNFRYTITAPQLVAQGGVATRYEVTINLTSGGPIRQAWEVHASSFLGSV